MTSSRIRFFSIDYSKEPDYNPADLLCQLCYEVWEYDNYGNEHYYCNVFMDKSAAYKEADRLMKRHDEDEDGSDPWDYWWILELTIQDHNKMMKKMKKVEQIITL